MLLTRHMLSIFPAPPPDPGGGVQGEGAGREIDGGRLLWLNAKRKEKKNCGALFPLPAETAGDFMI